MNETDSNLKVYSQSGLRTVADWTSRGRAIAEGAVPRAEASQRGILSPLYSRDQTHLLRPTR